MWRLRRVSSAKRDTNLATAGLAAAAVLVFGATAAFAATSSSASSASTPKSRATDQFSDVSGTRGGLPGGAGFGQGPHGDETVRDATGQWVEEIWQTGKVDAVSGDEVTVTDGSSLTWHWTVSSTAKVVTDGVPGNISAIKVGDTVSLSGTQTGTAHNATAVTDPGSARGK